MSLEDLPVWLREEYEAARQRRWMRFWHVLAVVFSIAFVVSVATGMSVASQLVLGASAAAYLMIARWNT